MNDNFVKDLISQHESTIPKMWENSLHEKWYFRINNQNKGKVGSEIVKQFLVECGFEAEIVSDKGDIIYKKPEDLEYTKAEVKISKANLECLLRPKNFITEELWFNQLRAKQSGWSEIFLVGIYPNHWRIWRKSREEFEDQINTLSSFNKKLSHVEADDPTDKNLRSVGLIKNTKSDNFHEWDEIFNNQKGDLY